MAGFLDSIFASNTDDPRYGANMALFANMIGGNLPQGLLAHGQIMGGAQDAKLKRGLLEAQIAETQAQAQERKSKMEMAQQTQLRQDRFLNGDPGGVSSGAFAPSADGMGRVMPQGAAPQSGGLIEQARAMGIPEKAIQSDVIFNGGKGISDMLFKRGTPDMQVTNGYAYDKNKQGAGFMPFLNTATSGQTSMGRVGPDGLPVISAPQGAMETYNAYQGAGARIGSEHKVNLRKNADGTESPITEASEIYGRPKIAPTVQRGRDTEALQTFKSELQNPNLPADQRAGLEREIARMQAAQSMPGFPTPTIAGPTGYGKTTTQTTADEVAKAKALDDAKAASARDATLAKGAVNSADTLNYIKEARALFKKGPTASGMGSLVDAGAGAFGMSTPGADAAAQLDTLSGWMVSNVPRMEGPQSNYDVQNYKTMAGMMGDRTKPLSQRMAALDTLKRLQLKYAPLNGQSQGGATESFDDAKEKRYQAWKAGQGK